MNKTVRVRLMLCVLGLAAVMVLTGGCHGKKPPVDTGLGNEKAVPEKTGGEGLPDVDVSKLPPFEPSGLAPVYFDYDSFALRPDTLKTLADYAEKVKGQPEKMFQIEGHCDERGTQEYNLALGEKRALAVRDHLIKLGVSGDRIVTISYGKERPAVEGHDEAAWAKNRRCEFMSAVRK